MTSLQKMIAGLTALYAAFVFSTYQNSNLLKGQLTFMNTPAVEQAVKDVFVEQYFTVNMMRAFQGLKELYTRITVHTAAPEIFGESDFDTIMKLDTTSTMQNFPSGQVPAAYPTVTPEAVKDSLLRMYPAPPTLTQPSLPAYPSSTPSYYTIPSVPSFDHRHSTPGYHSPSSLPSITPPVQTPPVFPIYPPYVSPNSSSVPTYVFPPLLMPSKSSSSYPMMTTPHEIMPMPVHGAAPTTGTSSTEICSNGIDDDKNSLIDCSDSYCIAREECFVQPTTEVCNNGKDDDFNGLKDCADSACMAFPGC